MSLEKRKTLFKKYTNLQHRSVSHMANPAGEASSCDGSLSDMLSSRIR